MIEMSPGGETFVIRPISDAVISTPTQEHLEEE